uniref:Uncharacterized protein n=1 Tax=Sphaerodactylus townsendi TaxID=933632 RepID=A0ACB8E6G8_9SAUR
MEKLGLYFPLELDSYESDLFTRCKHRQSLYSIINLCHQSSFVISEVSWSNVLSRLVKYTHTNNTGLMPWQILMHECCFLSSPPPFLPVFLLTAHPSRKQDSQPAINVSYRRGLRGVAQQST